MKKYFFLTKIFLFALSHIYGQVKQLDHADTTYIDGIVVSKPDTIISKNACYFGIGKQMILSINYERTLIRKRHNLLSIQIGLGGIPGDAEMNEPRHNIILTGILYNLGYKGFYLQIGLSPTAYFYGNTTFVNLNGDFGLRYQSFKKIQLFAQLTYNPIIYTTHNNVFNVPFGVGIGFTF